MIKEITIRAENDEYNNTFEDGINWIIARKHQSGKSTIINSIMFALGADEKIFDLAEVKPDSVMLNIDDHIIYRSKSSWTIDTKPFNKKILNRLFVGKFPNIRFAYGSKTPDFINLISKFWLSQRKLTGNTDFNFPKESSMGNKDIDALLAGFEIDELVKLHIDKMAIDKENKKINDTVKLDNYIGDIEKIKLSDVQAYLVLDEKYKMISKDIMSIRQEMKRVNKIVDTHEKDSEYIKALKEYLNSLDKKVEFEGNMIKLDLWSLLGEELGATGSSISIRDYKAAKLELSGLTARIKELREVKKGIEIEANNLDIEPSIKRSVVKGLISDVTEISTDKKDTTELRKKLKKLKEQRNSRINEQRENIYKTLKDYGVKPSSEGLGHAMMFLIRASLSQENYTPQFILLDSIEEVGTQNNGDDNFDAFTGSLIPFIEQLKGQVFATYTDSSGKHDERTKSGKQIFLDDLIFNTEDNR